MADLFPRKGRLKIVNQNVSLSGDTLKFMLVDTTYSPSETHEFIDNGGASDPVDKEISVSGYARQTLATKATSDDGTRVKFTADNISWGTLATGQTIGYAILFKDTGTATTSSIIAVFDTNDLVTNGGTVTMNMPTNGWLNF
jgi:hypothetical protein